MVLKASFIFVGMVSLAYGQIPNNLVNPGLDPFTSGNKTYSGNNITLGNPGYKISSNANIQLKAKFEIAVGDGFEATNLTASGEAHLFTDPNILDIASFHANGFTGIPQYDRFEIGVILPKNIQDQIDNFLSTGVGINPYDPNQIKVYCGYTPVGSSNTYWRNGFYYHDFGVQANSWVEQSTPYKFRIRFAPPTVGDYDAMVFIDVNNQLITGSGLQLNVVSTSNPGFL